MNKVKFYMAGGMGGLTLEQQMEWRKDIEDRIKRHPNCMTSTYFFQPPCYYQPESGYENSNYHRSEREAFEFDIDRLRHSHVIIVNFNAPSSIGTSMELAIARENRIPIIGLNENANEFHPWLCECCTRICETREELVDHIVNYYLT